MARGYSASRAPLRAADHLPVRPREEPERLAGGTVQQSWLLNKDNQGLEITVISWLETESSAQRAPGGPDGGPVRLPGRARPPAGIRELAGSDFLP